LGVDEKSVSGLVFIEGGIVLFKPKEHTAS
jgi:hypothetical protein